MDLARFGHMQSDRLRLRPMAEADPAALVAALNDLSVSRWLSRVPHPYTLADAEDIIAQRVETPAPVWNIYDEYGLIGGVGLDAHLGYWLAPGAWGKGYATEAARLVLNAHFRDPEAGDVGSSYFNGNMASAAVLRKLGFVGTGPITLPCRSLGHDVDATEMVLTRDAYATQPRFTLRTERLVLNALRADDWPVVQTDWGDPDVARMTATLKPNWTADEARAWMDQRATQSHTGFGLAIRLHDCTLIGSVGMGGTPRNLGYLLGKRYWGNGYANEAVGAFLRAAFRQVPDLEELGASVFDDNPASARILQKLGFERTGAGDCSSLARLEPAANSHYRVTRHSLKV